MRADNNLHASVSSGQFLKMNYEIIHELQIQEKVLIDMYIVRHTLVCLVMIFNSG